MPSVVGVKGVPASSEGVPPPSSNSESPLSTALNMVDKKVRNLEKRKTRLDGYRADSERGKELNRDQLSAIAKYEEVLHTLEFARELSAQFKALVSEEERLKKKAAKRESGERARAEVKKLSQVLRLQGIMAKAPSLGEDCEVMAALPLNTKKAMSKLCQMVDSNEASTAETLLAIIDGKPGKKMGDVSYAEIKEAFYALEAAMDSKTSQEDDAPQIVEEVEDSPPEQEDCESPSQEEEKEQVPQESNTAESQGVDLPNGVVLEDNEQLQPPPQPQVQQQQEFNFLQESQIDPINMDPAVVVVQHSPPQVFSHIYRPVPPPFHPSSASNTPSFHPPPAHITGGGPPETMAPETHDGPLEAHEHAHSNNYHSSNHVNNNSSSKISHSTKNRLPEGPHSQPTIEDWSEDNEALREISGGGHNGSFRGRGRGRGYRGGGTGGSGPRKDNGVGYRGGRGNGGSRGGRSRGGSMNGHYRGNSGGENKEYRGRGGRGGTRGSYRGTSEKPNGHPSRE